MCRFGRKAIDCSTYMNWLQLCCSAQIADPWALHILLCYKSACFCRRLMAESLAVECIYASQDHAQRTSAFAAFRSGKVWILVTTDLLARGIDFIGVKTVINYDCPKSLQDYVHRVGRTGRASQSGMAVTFFTEGDTEMVRPIANLIKEAGQPVPEWMLLKNHRSREVDAKRTHKPKRLRTK